MQPERRKILMVEDRVDDSKLLAQCLPCFDVKQVQTVSEAVAALTAPVNYSAIVLDLRLPDGVGEKVIDRVHERAPSVPIVVVTGMGPEEMSTVVVRRHGAKTILRKPVVPEELREALIQVIPAKEAEEKYGPLEAFLDQAIHDSALNLPRPVFKGN